MNESTFVTLDGSLLVRPFKLAAERWGYIVCLSPPPYGPHIFVESQASDHQCKLQKLMGLKFGWIYIILAITH
jgi:hypothetical protein